MMMTAAIAIKIGVIWRPRWTRTMTTTTAMSDDSNGSRCGCHCDAWCDEKYCKWMAAIDCNGWRSAMISIQNRAREGWRCQWRLLLMMMTMAIMAINGDHNWYVVVGEWWQMMTDDDRWWQQLITENEWWWCCVCEGRRCRWQLLIMIMIIIMIMIMMAINGYYNTCDVW